MNEASMNFDMENVEPFLSRLEAHLALGLPVQDLVAMTRSVEIEAEVSRTFQVTFSSSPATLEYRVFLDDVDAPDLYFLTTSKPLADAIQAELNQFADDNGL
jgi:hypothetical protein